MLPLAAALALLAACGPAGAARSGSPAGAARSGSPAGAARSGSPAGSPTGGAAYGGLPSWLPKATPVGRVVTASVAHPKLGIEGDTMVVELAGVHAAVTVVGPAVPEEGQFPIPASTRCTFTVTVADASGPVRVSASEFAIVDELSRLHHPRLVRPGGGPTTFTVGPGAPVSFRLVASLPPGSGMVSWAALGAATVASWDFDVEID